MWGLVLAVSAGCVFAGSVFAGSVFAGSVFAGCSGGDTDTDSGGTDSGLSTPPTGEALVLASGEGTQLDGHYSGTEVLTVVSDRGQGVEVCRVEYTLASVGTRDDCDDCVWALDLVIDDVVPVSEVGTSCLPIEQEIAALQGSSASYGFAREHIGHADALMSPVDDRWTAVAFAGWDEATGAFLYDWERGLVELP